MRVSVRKNVRKWIILSVKIVISIALLWWVLKGVSWHDFVLDADGRTHIAVQDVQDAGSGGLLLVRQDGSSVVRPADGVLAADPGAATPAGRYIRPGFLRVVRDIRWPVLAAGSLLFLLQLFVIGYRWWRLLSVQGIAISYREVLRLTWLGTFFNYIVLGTTGGDLIKAYYASRHTPHKTECLVTVFVDRLLGLIGLTLLSVIMLAVVLAGRALTGEAGLFAGEDAGKLTVAAAVAGGVTAGLLGLGAFAFSRRLRWAFRLNEIYRRLPLGGHVGRVGEALRLYRHHLPALVRAMGHTLIVHLMFVAGIALAGVSLGLPIPWYQYVIYIPLIYIIAAVPIVPGGVGLAESFYVTFFIAWAGRSEILALALLARLIPMFWALPGILVAITGPRIPHAEQIQAEMAQEAGVPGGDAAQAGPLNAN